jgi:hypothetical protein
VRAGARPASMVWISMKTTSRSKRQRRCAHCGRPFIVNPRLGKRHRFCAASECVATRKKKAQVRWLKKNGGKSYYISHSSRDRVAEWRKKNPGYWRRSDKKRRGNQSDFVITKELKSALRLVALQDSIDTHLPLIIGLISRISKSALQDSIAKELRQIMMLGRGILTQNTNPKKRPRRFSRS